MFFPLKMQHYNNIKETEMSFKKENSTFIGVLNDIDKSDRFNASRWFLKTATNAQSQVESKLIPHSSYFFNV